MKATVLSGPVISGSIPEVHFHVSGKCTWVLFDDGIDPWAGVFGRGQLAIDRVAFFNQNHNAFVIAGGQGYVIDVPTRQLLIRTEIDWLTGALGLGDTNLVVVCDFTRLYAYDTNTCLWQSQRVACDGIILDSWDGENVLGKVWQLDGWYTFTLTANPWRFHQGSTVTHNRSEFSEFTT